MRYLSVCSGIEAASVAWEPLGWECAAVAEIDRFPSAVLAHHYPEVPNAGDFTAIEADTYGAVDLLVGGTPCQSFSVAGLRGGLADDRGNLALEFARLAQRIRPRWILWENVPGVLSSSGGRDFGSILGALAELGYGWAYRVLDAQHFGVPQRRRRVFVVGCLGDWRRAAAVLFERHSLSGHPAPRRETGKVAPTIPSRSTASGGLGTDFECDGGLIAQCLTTGTGRRYDAETETLVPAIGFIPKNSAKTRSVGEAIDQAPTVTTHQMGQGVATRSAVRRLTPEECEALQGFPRGFTRIPWRGRPAEECPDGPRYKAIGNSMAVPVMRWIGERIQAVEAIAHG